MPGDTKDVVDGYLAEALGDLADRVEISTLQEGEATRSPIGNPLWDAVATHTQVAYPGADLVPGLITGGTDARFFREQGIGRLRRRAVLPRRSRSSRSAAASTATTSASTPSRSGCRPSSGTASPWRSRADRWPFTRRSSTATDAATRPFVPFATMIFPPYAAPFPDGATPPVLGAQERAMLTVLAQRPGKVVTGDVLAQRLGLPSLTPAPGW